MKRRLLFAVIILLLVMLTGCSDRENNFSQMTYTSGTHSLRLTFENYGNIDIRMFNSKEPECVDLFVNELKIGSFDNIPVNRGIDDYYISFGKATDGTVNETYSPDSELAPFYGALCVSRRSGYLPSCTEAMIITTTPEMLASVSSMLEYSGYSFYEYLEAGYGVILDESGLNAYMEHGGAPWLYGHCTVIGQICDGFDVLERISADISEGKDSSEVVLSSYEYI